MEVLARSSPRVAQKEAKKTDKDALRFSYTSAV